MKSGAIAIKCQENKRCGSHEDDNGGDSLRACGSAEDESTSHAWVILLLAPRFGNLGLVETSIRLS